MWFDKDLKPRRKRSFFRKNRLRRHPALRVNARLAGKRKEWVTRAGIALLLAVTVGVAFLLGGFVLREAEGLLLSNNPEYTLTNYFIACESESIKQFVAEQTGIKVGTNLFLVDIRKLRRDIEKTPNIKSAVLSRILPGTLKVELVERLPIARLGNRADRRKYLVVDDEGIVFLARSRSSAEALPMITGYAGRRQSPGNNMMGTGCEDALAVFEVCNTSKVGDIITFTHIDLGDKYVAAKLVNGPVVFLAWDKSKGGKDSPNKDLEERLEFLCGILREADKRNVSLRSINLMSDDYTQDCRTEPRWDRRN